MKTLKIRFLNGPQKGAEFLVQNQLLLKRTKDRKNSKVIPIKDPKASNPHAEVVKKSGRFYLKDKNSKNGTLLKGKINDLFVLKPGIVFQIGKTQLKVFSFTPPPPKNWRKEVLKILHKANIKNQPQKLKAFDTGLDLVFKSGKQKGEVWPVDHGPVVCGGTAIDIPLWEPSAPEVCFSLDPKEGFKTPHPEKVRLNGKHIPQKKLKNGDRIVFGGTLIEIRMKKKSGPKSS